MQRLTVVDELLLLALLSPSQDLAIWTRWFGESVDEAHLFLLLHIPRAWEGALGTTGGNNFFFMR